MNECSDDCMKDESDDLYIDVVLKQDQVAENEQASDCNEVRIARVPQLLNTLESHAFFWVANL